MKQWNYLQASLHPADSDEVSGILWDLGTQGIEEDSVHTGRLRIKAYFAPSHDIQSLHRKFKALCHQAGVRLLSCSLKVQIERDWFKKWRHQLQPFNVGKRFQIIPCDTPRLPLDAHRLAIHLEPGMAFGTGTHETTQLCLEAIERYLRPGATFFDVGTGSGILAIAALKLGAKRVTACDIDPIAVEIAGVNGEKNQCGSKIRWVLGELDQVPRFKPDFLVANLTVELIEQEFKRFELRMRPGSYLVLSGLLNRQAARLEPLRRRGELELTARKKRGEWTCLVYRKPVRSDAC